MLRQKISSECKKFLKIKLVFSRSAEPKRRLVLPSLNTFSTPNDWSKSLWNLPKNCICSTPGPSSIDWDFFHSIILERKFECLVFAAKQRCWHHLWKPSTWFWMPSFLYSTKKNPNLHYGARGVAQIFIITILGMKILALLCTCLHDQQNSLKRHFYEQ